MSNFITVDSSGQINWQAAALNFGAGLLINKLQSIGRSRKARSQPSRIPPAFRALAQELANQMLPRGREKLRVDGVIGPVSQQVFRILTSGQGIRGADRLVAGIFQKASGGGLKTDFFWGPQTEAVAELIFMGQDGRTLPTRPDEEPDAKPKKRGQIAQAFDKLKKPKQPKVKCWKPTDRENLDHYGQPGSGQELFTLPYACRLSWDHGTTVRRASMHRLVGPRAQMALEQVAREYTADDRRDLGLDLFGGCLNVRKKRGGSTWSMHAFGAALDWDPDRNPLRATGHTASFATAFYKPWLQAWTDAGFMSLGSCYDFDWMHFQLNPGSP
jgi:hypothetical protein